MTLTNQRGEVVITLEPKPKKHLKCRGYTNWALEFDCEYESTVMCEDCRYGGHGGRKDPEAKVNQL